MKTLRLGNIGALKIRARITAVYGFILLWFILSLIGWLGLEWGARTVALTALFATFLHFCGEFWHQLGHAWTARHTGWPMNGILFVWVLAASLYPRDEPELPARIHIRRALGGPAASLVMTVLMGLIVWGIRPITSPTDYLILFYFLDNFFVFTLGALLPLGFTDGSTLLNYWAQLKIDN